MESNSFSIGYRYYYWSFYKNITEIDPKEQNPYNIDNHGGFAILDLFIPHKYSSFKDEIFAYYTPKSLCQIDWKEEYETKITIKINLYIGSASVKKRRAKYDHQQSLHYEIDQYAPLLKDHLLALILYCDYTDLSTDFSSTFRKNEQFESFDSVKIRNQSYAWLSQRLRECVELYGHNGVDKNDNGDGLTGPFFCGMSVVMTVYSFAIRLYSPTSTSKQLGTAQKFSKQNGMIMEFKNDVFPGNEYLRGFICKWLSNYGEEDEVLFMGGFWPIHIYSIRINEKCDNYQEYMYALNLYELDHYADGEIRSLIVNELKENRHNEQVKYTESDSIY